MHLVWNYVFGNNNKKKNKKEELTVDGAGEISSIAV